MTRSHFTRAGNALAALSRNRGARPLESPPRTIEVTYLARRPGRSRPSPRLISYLTARVLRSRFSRTLLLAGVPVATVTTREARED